MVYRFDQYIRDTANDCILLPLIHTTDGWGLRDILESKTLKPQPCPVFDQTPLLYFFYGRPAYRRSNEEANSLESYLPVCLILSPGGMKGIKRIFPFDTGAFSLGLYGQHLHDNMSINHFEVSPDLLNASKIVSKFFGTNKEYFNGIPKADPGFSSFHFEAQSYLNLLKQESKTRGDDRRGTIEIQCDSAVIVEKHAIDSLIIPAIFADEEELLEVALCEWKAELITYDTYHMRVLEYTSEIYALARRRLEKNGFL